MQFTKAEIKTLLVNYHNLNTNLSFSLKDVFLRLNLVQFDPLNVVGTNAELVLQSRVPNFTKTMLSHELYQTRYLVDGWDKQMCIYESSYIPHYSRVREERAEASAKSLVKYFQYDVHSLTDEVYRIIKDKGPIFSSEIDKGGHVDYYWSKAKTSTITLDYLFHKGMIGVHSRKNTQKRYADMKTIYPSIEEPDPFQIETEFTDFLLLRRIQSCGIIRNKNSYLLSGHTITNKNTRTASLQRLIAQNKVQEITIEGLSDPYYIPTEMLNLDNHIIDKISFIAPLDNLIWDRTLLLELFNFDYIWEVYTPKTKRKWGYYVLPILRGDTFIGRIEFANSRPGKPLEILSILWEDNIKQTKKLQSLMNQALERFKTYLDATDILYPSIKE